ncbi:hypothetical protein EYS14_13440 [Alteromonadaceae bacterium M269]|nr:hypothetical protein EYS14_13440 [Alteromonadaceae bacterium M269]
MMSFFREGKLVAVIIGILAAYLLFHISPIVTTMNFNGAKQLGAVLQSFGATILTISMITIFYDLLMKSRQAKATKKTLEEAIDKKFESLNSLKASGIESAYEVFPEEDVGTLFVEAQEEITIVQTWIPEDLSLASSISKALLGGCTINVYLVKPGCYASKQRSKEIYEGSITFENEVSNYTHTSIIRLRQAVNQNPYKENLKFYFYEGTPTMAIYSADGVSFVGLYFRNKNSKSAAHFKVGSPTSYFGKTIKSHIKAIKTEATLVPDDYEYKSQQYD